jgi:hypothetical protein
VQEKKERLKRQVDEARMKECTFQPNLKRHSSQQLINMNKYDSRKPIHNRVGQVLKNKQEHKELLRIKNENAEKEVNTFRPKINKKSDKIMQVTRMS